MKTVGIVAEYNPFHNGHLHHIEKSKEITGSENVIAVMSGNFVQRGDIAIMSKYARTKIALLNGVDMVIELPVCFAASSAEFFAKASIAILNGTGIVDSICFGSESGNISELKKISKFLMNESDEYKKALKEGLKQGLSFPSARSIALKNSFTDSESLLQSPNNILAVEYLKALQLINSSIAPFTISREIAHYHNKELTEKISSATAIRNELQRGNINCLKNTVPENSIDIWHSEMALKNTPVFIDELSSIFHYILATKSAEELKDILDMDEGLENRLLRVSSENYLISNIIKALKSKRYAQTKIQRAVIHILLGIKKKEFKELMQSGGPPYIRVLGFKKEKSFLLKEIEEKGTLPLITNIKKADTLLDEKALNLLEKEISSTDIYLLARGENSSKLKYEYYEPIVIV